jgi:hypothetical protein
VNYSLLVMETTGMMKMASPLAEYQKRAVYEIMEVQRLAAASRLTFGGF